MSPQTEYKIPDTEIARNDNIESIPDTPDIKKDSDNIINKCGDNLIPLWEARIYEGVSAAYAEIDAVNSAEIKKPTDISKEIKFIGLMIKTFRISSDIAITDELQRRIDNLEDKAA
ncbi:MAG: hypothetical protein PWQ10_407 [Patescibacteria group bacterium]|nr:hypothetical protein [Patescibacteria group bacterium]